MNAFKGRHFEGEIVLWAVRWYCRYGISYRDLEQMMAERGVNVDHTTIYRWVQRYAPEMEKRLRWQWCCPKSQSWRIDETYVKVRGPVGVPVSRRLPVRRPLGFAAAAKVWSGGPHRSDGHFRRDGSFGPPVRAAQSR